MSDLEGEILQEESVSSGEEADDDEDSNPKTVKWKSKVIPIKMKQFVRPQPGPTIAISSTSLPLEFFYEIYPDEIFNLMAKSTNQCIPIYEAQRKQKNPEFSSGSFKADADDIKAFIGIRMIMALNPLPSLTDYWSSDPAFRNYYIAETMLRNQFFNIQKCFNVNGPTKNPSRIACIAKAKEILKKNPLYKVQPLIEAVRENSSNKYNLHRDISIDEAMIKFTGQHWCVVGAPNKPAKRGIKIFCLCDGSTGYLKDFQLYIRHKKETGLTQKM